MHGTRIIAIGNSRRGLVRHGHHHQRGVGSAGGGYDGTLGEGVEALWYDTWLHGDDIRSAIGRPSELGSGLGCALSHVDIELKKLAWTDGVPSVDDPKALAFILAATGRIDSVSFGPQAPTNLYAVT